MFYYGSKFEFHHKKSHRAKRWLYGFQCINVYRFVSWIADSLS